LYSLAKDNTLDKKTVKLTFTYLVPFEIKQSKYRIWLVISLISWAPPVIECFDPLRPGHSQGGGSVVII